MFNSPLLISEPPLNVLPSLAVAIGLNEAIIIQQLHYWLGNPKAGVVREGQKWIFNTYAEWQENFPFWSTRTIRRIFSDLEEHGLIITRQFDQNTRDMKKYYRIDYDRIARLHVDKLATSHVDKLATSIGPDWPHVPITETICTETTSETTNTPQTPKRKVKVKPEPDLLSDEPKPPTKSQMRETEIRQSYNELHVFAGLPEPATITARDRAVVAGALIKGITMARLGAAWAHALETSEVKYWPLHRVYEQLHMLEYEMANPLQKIVRKNGRLTQEEIQKSSDIAWATAFGGALCDQS